MKTLLIVSILCLSASSFAEITSSEAPVTGPGYVAVPNPDFSTECLISSEDTSCPPATLGFTCPEGQTSVLVKSEKTGKYEMPGCVEDNSPAITTGG